MKNDIAIAIFLSVIVLSLVGFFALLIHCMHTENMAKINAGQKVEQPK